MFNIFKNKKCSDEHTNTSTFYVGSRRYSSRFVEDLIEENKKLKEEIEILMRGD